MDEPLIPDCPSCGYSLQGLPERGECPECGRTYFQPSGLFQPRKQYRYHPDPPAFASVLIVGLYPILYILFTYFVVFCIYLAGGPNITQQSQSGGAVAAIAGLVTVFGLPMLCLGYLLHIAYLFYAPFAFVRYGRQIAAYFPEDRRACWFHTGLLVVLSLIYLYFLVAVVVPFF
ncbi:MAG: hypothetical protein RIG82_01040 [Phycisphaeraceae bacterium]